MKFLFRKSRKQASQAVADKDSASLAARVERILRITQVMADRSMNQDPRIGKLAGSHKLHKAFDQIDKLPPAELEQLLDMLEAGIPEEFRAQIKEG